ncbi:hypothetical protein [Streptomyces sp. NPDC086787]|uniref:hypothetical protein n=1 Tax=Streptomyces sp. NPDC086787 TaxID=3365759 RepID=UPI0038092598
MQCRKAPMTAAFASLVLAGVVAATAPSYAADTTAAASAASTTAHAKGTKGPKGDGAGALCKKVPKLEERIDKRIKRMEGPVGKRGSIKFLEQRIANARSENHTAIAEFLGDRLTTRKTLLPLLKQKQTDLKDVATWCGANNNGKPAGTS